MELFGYDFGGDLSLPGQNTAALPSQPVDAAGGAPASYGQQTMDLFKYGLSAVVAERAQTNELDYKRFETTNGQLNAQGQRAGVQVPGVKSPVSPLLLIGGGVILIGLLVWKFK